MKLFDMYVARVTTGFALLCAMVVAPASACAQSADHRAAARAALNEAFLAAARDSVDRWIDVAVEHARSAIVAAPNDADAHYWLAAALGRRAQRSSFTGAIRAGKESYQEARRALELDSLHAGAHAVVGRFMEEGAHFSRPLRLLVASMTGMSDIRHASMAEAEREYRAAVRLDSTSFLFRHDLGRFFADAGRLSEAEQQWRAVQALPITEPVEAWLRDDLRHHIDAATHRR
jgi:Flp pilus assembly protein TadD